MKIASTIARYLLGLMFAVFGLNGFLHFIPQPPPQSPLAVQFLTSASISHFMVFVFLVQVIGGAMLLAGRFVPFALVLLAPVIVNILDYHLTMDPAGIPAGLVAAILWILVFSKFRSNFAGILQSQPTPSASLS